jgi:hypothetical protein
MHVFVYSPIETGYNYSMIDYRDKIRILYTSLQLQETQARDAYYNAKTTAESDYRKGRIAQSVRALETFRAIFWEFVK